MKSFTSFIFISLIFLTTQGCSQQSSAPTNFQLTLGAAISDVGMDGGIILLGTNGSDRFSAGLTPLQANNFGLELPSGDWNFQAVGWMNDGSGMMTGESRCAHASATIEGSETIVKLSLSKAQCTDGVVALSSSLDTSFATAPHFKKVGLVSCLTLSGIGAGNLCSGTSNADLPGFSTSARVVFPGNSNFGASLPTLQSGCYNHPGYASNSFSNGYIPTTVRLPYDGTVKLPLGLVGYEKKDCQERGAIYKMPDGINGTQGLDRLYDYLGNEITVNFADNYIGGGNSVFAGLTPGDIVPEVACAPNCYPDATYEPFDNQARSRELIKQEVWQVLGNADGLDSKAVQGASSAFINSAVNDLTFQSYPEDGSLGNATSVKFFNTTLPVGTFAQVFCTERSISINYDQAQGATTDHIVQEVNAQCGQIVMASTGSPGQAVTDINSYTLTGGSNNINMTSRETGDLLKVRDLLIGPIGAALYKNGIVDRATLCNTSSYGSYSFIIDGENITMELGAPSAAAKHPAFAPNAAAPFEKRIRIFFDGVPEEAIYFNCSLDPEVGAYLSRSEESDGNTRTRQLFWSSVTAGAEWVEAASKEEDPSGNLVGQYFLLFKATATNDFDAYTLQAHTPSVNYTYAVGRASAGDIYVQGNSTTATDGSPDFSRFTQDEYYSMTSDAWLGTVTKITREPSTINASMITPNMFGGYEMSSFTSGVDNFWDFSY